MSSTLAKVLAQSLKRNGDKPLTIGHLLNIVKMAERLDNMTAEKYEQFLDQCRDDVSDNWGDE